MEVLTREKNVVFLWFHLLDLFSVMLIRTLRRCILEPKAKSRHAATRVLCKLLGILQTIFLNEISASFSYLVIGFMSLRC
jgi:hypothetical protein